MAKKPSTAVAKAPAKRNSLISDDMSELPDFMKGHENAGTENLDRDDLEIPRLKLIQGISPELQEYNDLRSGNFLHTASEEIFDGPFLAVPIYMDKRYVLWRPRDEGGGILARADDGVHWNPANATFDVKLDKKDGGKKVTWKTAKTVQQSGLAEWGTLNPDDPDSPPAATLMYSYVLAFPNNPELVPAVLTFQRSSIRAGRRFNTKLKTIRAPMYGLVFEFDSVLEKNGAGQDFFNVQIRGAGRVADEDLFNEYAALHDGFREAGLAIKDLEGAQDEDAALDDDEDVVETKSGKRPRF